MSKQKKTLRNIFSILLIYFSMRFYMTNVNVPYAAAPLTLFSSIALTPLALEEETHPLVAILTIVGLIVGLIFSVLLIFNY